LQASYCCRAWPSTIADAEAEAKQLRARLFYAVSAIVIMAALLTLSTAVTFLGTNRVVKKYRYTETRGAMLTNEDGETLACTSAEFAPSRQKTVSDASAVIPRPKRAKSSGTGTTGLPQSCFEIRAACTALIITLLSCMWLGLLLRFVSGV